MRDALAIFGDLSLATKDTQVYAAAPEGIKLADTNTGSRFSKYHLGDADPDLVACFSPQADFAWTSATEYDDAAFIIQDSADGTNWLDLARGPNVAGPAPAAATIKAGMTYRIAMPKDHRQYIRLSAIPLTVTATSRAFTAKTVSCWLEHGAQQNL